MTTPVNGTSSTSADPTQYVADASKLVTKNEFLLLLSTQLQNQDPLNPSSQDQMLGQLAQFSSLEQMTQMTESVTQLQTTNAWTQAVGMMGRIVKVDSPQGSLVGQVSGVVEIEGTPHVMMGDVSYPLSAVKEVWS